MIIFFTLIFLSLFSNNLLSNNIDNTNLNGVSIPRNSDNTAVIQYGDKTKEKVLNINTFITLFINGSIVKDANIITENNRTLVPLMLISETLGAKVDWDDQFCLAY